MSRRIERVNSLLKEVLCEIIRSEVKHPDLHSMTTVSRVETSKDLRHAKVYVSIIASDEERAKTLAALQSAAGFIAYHSSKKVVLRYFPDLVFRLDETVDQQMRIQTILTEIEKKNRGES